MVEISSGWEGIDAAREDTGVDQNASSQTEIAQAFTRCFATSPGCQVLDHLRAITLDRSLGPHASEALLRHAEGQRQLVLHIITLIAKGREGV